MKLSKFLGFLFILFLIPAYSFSSSLELMHISLIDGDVQIRTEDTEEWVPASINMPLRDSERIWVPEGGKLELRLRDGTYLRLNERSALEVLTLEKDSFQFYLTEGDAYVNFRGERGSFLQMDMPVSSIRVFDRSIFKVGLSGEGLHQVSVLKGSVDVESRSGKTTVKSGYTLTLKGETYAELSPLGPPDDWERWNTERDRKLAERRPPPSYLPEELHAYSSDFDTYGRWIYVREYGYVWRPTLVVSVGWAPYRIGRWVWIRGDYVWISYEPWGWVPYHYGRWAFVASFGWCWIPPVRGAVFWGPGFVAWVRTPTYVAWVPLGPREIYYGHGYYGPHSVNIRNVYVTNIQVSSVAYKNIHVENAVTVVHHDTFVKGRHVPLRVTENPFLREPIHMGRPDIKPERTTVMPVVKEVPQAKQPPEPIREIRVKELKEKHPFVKERNVSVLRPESPPKEMTPRVKEGTAFEREFEKTRAPSPTQPRAEKPREPKPTEKAIERRPESKQDIKGLEKAREIKSPQRPVEKTGPTQQKIDKPQEPGPQSKSPERVIERPPETKPPEKGVERPKESRPAERGIERPREVKPSEGVQRPPETTTQQRGAQSRRELRHPERQIQTPRESTPQNRGIVRSGSLEVEEARPSEPRSTERRPVTPGAFPQRRNLR